MLPLWSAISSWSLDDPYAPPTRALVNDLYERLRGPASQLGLILRRRTGDHRERVEDIPHIVLTTPESFDSLLCRGRNSAYGHSLGFVSAVVLDEIHLLHGTARGEQLRWLMARLARVRTQMVESGLTRRADVQLVALSATIPDPEFIAFGGTCLPLPRL